LVLKKIELFGYTSDRAPAFESTRTALREQLFPRPTRCRRGASPDTRHCIKDGAFIDPPYNTGHDFVYEDDFAEDASGFLLRDGQEDLLFQVMLDLGVPLSAKIRLDGDVYYVNDNYLIACFGRADTALTTEIARKKPYYAVFRDSSFASDSAMVNFEQVFVTYSPNTIRRVL
jgi:adenine-specific DNA-methyltransferase